MPLVLQQLGAEVNFSNMYLMQILSLWVLCLVWGECSLVLLVMLVLLILLVVLNLLILLVLLGF